ncbi:MAG: helix-turn-helix domain-containing protein [Nocardiopsaceae bacterium]|jgi:predicted ArsR family transcriptional regulator|nr:helix-turn-helix domain-containing protein [Nocardiopsaceae bacterium]
MDTQELLAPDASAPLGRSRGRVLDLLRATGSPMSVQDVADQTGLHPNTARFHLDGLVKSGQASREPQARETPGRPSMAYRAVGGGQAGERRYRLLAEMLTSLITGMIPEPGRAATEAGREWGAYLAEQPPPYQRLTAGEAIAKLTAIMEDLGFGPQAVSEGEQYQLRLHECPFREIAQHQQDVVCAMHKGLMQGALAKMRAPLTADRLEPFVEPSLCVAHVTGHREPGSRKQARGDSEHRLT